MVRTARLLKKLDDLGIVPAKYDNDEVMREITEVPRGRN
jgi:hypothetical protein